MLTFTGNLTLLLTPPQIWLHVPNERPHKTDPELSKPAVYGIVEKKSMINLVSRVTCLQWQVDLIRFSSKALLFH